MCALQREFKTFTDRACDPPLSVPRLAWWLPGPHLQTIFAKMVRGIPMPPTTRETWRMADGDTASIERVWGHSNAPRVIIFHGLEGGAHSTYARGVLHEAIRRGWFADLVLWRTCDGRLVNDVVRSYHSGASDDAAEAIAHILRGDPERPTFLLGVSLGGNVMLKWLAEHATQMPPAITAAAGVSVPFDLAAASRKLEQGFSRVYSRFFLRKLQAKAVAKLDKFPQAGDRASILGTTTLEEFDNLFTAPVNGFADAADYYERSSALRFLQDIRVPSLLFNAIDDPFLPPEVLDEVRAAAAGNPNLRCVFPPNGGHVGFVAGSMPGRPVYWMESAVLDWFERHLQRHG